MGDVLISYETRVSTERGPAYAVQACGRPINDNQWEGWLEFLPEDGSEVLRTRRETTQPNREDLEYWASGLEPVYLEGALHRALTPERVITVAPPVEASVYDGPEPGKPHTHRSPASPIDPYRIHASQGNEVLERQLAALDNWQLRNVVIAHTDVSETEAEGMDRQGMTSAIMAAVRG